MSLDVSAVSIFSASHAAEDTTVKQPPVPKLTADQEMVQLYAAGQSISEIAVQVGLPTSLVTSTLQPETTTTPAASAVKLSVKA